MSRLISTRELNNVVTKRKDEYGRLAVEVDNIVEEMVKETPTVQQSRKNTNLDAQYMMMAQWAQEEQNNK